MHRFIVIAIAIATALMGEPLAAGMLLLGYEVGGAVSRGGFSQTAPVQEPDCMGTYPFLNAQAQNERECGSCPFAQDCYEESPHPFPRGSRR